MTIPKPAINSASGKPSRKGAIPGLNWQLSLLVFLLVLHPIVAADFWWQLARGRAIWEGHLTPANVLLAYESKADADWLSGLPWYILYTSVGPSILCSVIAIVALVVANSIGSKGHHFSAQNAIVFLGFFAARNSWTATPTLIDLIGVLFTWHLAGRLRGRGRWNSVIGLMVWQLLWANFATLPLLGLLVLYLRLNHVGRNRLPVLNQFGLGALMCLFGSITPRWHLTLWDSFRLLVPWTSADLGTLEFAGLLTPFRWPFQPEIVAFVMLGAALLFSVIRRSIADNRIAWGDIGMALILFLLAGSSTANFGPIAFLLMLWTIEILQHQPQPVGESVSPRTQFAWSGNQLFATSALFALSVASGFWPDSPTRLGWGLATQLEMTLIEDAMSDIKLSGTGYCSGVRETGMLAWLRPGSIRPADEPSRALLSGRLAEHVRIGWDLARGWRDQHRRSDLSWGGWLLPLRKRNTQLLMIASNAFTTIRGLEPSFWKPLAIDTPCIPYVFADTPSINRRIVYVASLLDMVETGEWTYPIPSPSGNGSHFDLYGWVTRYHDLNIDLRQARVLRAMKRNIAAMKVIASGLRRGAASARREFREIQLSFAYSEFLETGQATSWRMLAYLESGGDAAVLESLNPSGQTVPACLPIGFQDAIRAYLRNDYDLAKRSLPDTEAKSLYAMSQIALEQGDPKQAARCINRLISKFPSVTESKAVFNVLAQLSE